MRAQSTATLPSPQMATLCILLRSRRKFAYSGCPLYHHTNSLADSTPDSFCIRYKAVCATEYWFLMCLLFTHSYCMQFHAAKAESNTCTAGRVAGRVLGCHLSRDVQLLVALCTICQDNLTPACLLSATAPFSQALLRSVDHDHCNAMDTIHVTAQCLLVHCFSPHGTSAAELTGQHPCQLLCCQERCIVDQLQLP